MAKYLPDGRLICVFRNVEKCTFDGWVGRWQDLVQGRDGEASLTLLRHIPQDGQFSPDCGYPGLEVLADRTVLAVTYLHYRREDRGKTRLPKVPPMNFCPDRKKDRTGSLRRLPGAVTAENAPVRDFRETKKGAAGVLAGASGNSVVAVKIPQERL